MVIGILVFIALIIAIIAMSSSSKKNKAQRKLIEKELEKKAQ